MITITIDGKGSIGGRGVLTITMDGKGSITLGVEGGCTLPVESFCRFADAVRVTHARHGGDGVPRGIRIVTPDDDGSLVRPVSIPSEEVEA